MTKTITYIIATFNIVVSFLTYLQIYFVMIESDPSSKGFAEYFALISSILFIINGFCLASIINSISKHKKYLTLSFYLLIGIIPLAIQNQFTLIPTIIFSIIVMRISYSLISKIKNNYLTMFNGILLILNLIWGIFISGM